MVLIRDLNNNENIYMKNICKNVLTGCKSFITI